jgi:Carboxypeptidase regulatory-like domain/TonB dependent receptor-like, beta-barrel
MSFLLTLFTETGLKIQKETAMKRWTLMMIILLPLSFGMGGASAFAQFTSGIEGIVHDTTGAVVPGAKITITDTRLGVSKSVVSGQDGYFRIDGIAASTYDIRIQMAGFQTWTQSGLMLQIAQVRTLTPELKVGAVSTNVEVSATAAAVDLVTPTTGSVISNEVVTTTPLSGQNIYGLASLTPGMTGGGVVTAGNDNYTNEYAINLNAAGLRQEENGYQIDDGYTNTPSRGGGTSISPNPEIVQSIDVRTNDFDAQKGRNGGATVDVYTKSGSNEFHGTVDYYFTNAALSALTHFQSTVPSFTRNEMGATMGGPVFKNKLFWFGALDVLRESTPSSYTATVETQDFFNWAKTYESSTVGFQEMTMAPPQSYPTTGLVPYTAYESGTPGYFPPPSGAALTALQGINIIGTIPVSYSAPKDGYQWSFRVDDYIGNRDRLYVDVIRTDYSGPGGGTRPASVQGNKNSSDFINFNWTHTFSPHFFNETGVNLIRPYGSNTTQVATEGIPYINVTNLSGFGSWAPGNFTQSTYSWRDVMTANIRTHTLKFGVDLFNTREVDHQQGAFTRPTFNFRNLIDFVQDDPVYQSGPAVNLQNHQQAPYDRDYRDFIQGYYLQDDWKLTPQFTLNLGVRYDMMVNFFSINRPILSKFNLGSGSTWNAQVASGTAALAGTDHVLNHNIGGFTPRVGFAWDLFGKGKTALRGGFGMFEDQPPYLHITDSTAGNLPNYFTPIDDVTTGQPTPKPFICTPSGAWNVTCPVLDTSNITLNSSGAAVINGAIYRASMGGYNPNFKMQQVEAWSLSIQQQFQNNLIMEINYSGTEAHHLLEFNNDINRFSGDLIQNNNKLTRLNPYFAGTTWANSDANSFGNFGSVSIQRSFTHGLALHAIYGYGKALDEMSQAQSLDGGSITSTTNDVYITNDLPFQRGRADFDIRQQFTASGVWDVPSPYSSRALKAVLGGWEFGGDWVGYTGLPFTTHNGSAFIPICSGGAALVNNQCPSGSTIVGDAGGDYNADGTNDDIPNVPSFGRHLSGQSKTQFLNGIFKASDFPVPALGQEGNLGRNTYDNPGYKIMNFTFEKYFNAPWFFAEKVKIEAKGEVFNLFNRTNLQGVDSNLADGTFGQSTSQLPSRSLQLHLRASF